MVRSIYDHHDPTLALESRPTDKTAPNTVNETVPPPLLQGGGLAMDDGELQHEKVAGALGVTDRAGQPGV